MNPYRTLLVCVIAGLGVSSFSSSVLGSSPWPGYVPAEFLNDEYFVANGTAKPPVIDGDLSDPCWTDALELYPFSTLGGGGSLSLLQTRVKLTWDKDALYVAYHCEQPDMELAKRRGDHLEVFFMPLYPDKPYHANVATAILFLAGHKPEAFHYQQASGGMGGEGRIRLQKDAKVQSAGRIGDDWWTWEGKFRFQYLWTRGFRPPDPTKVMYWRLGFNRGSSFHGEIGWYASMTSSLNHQMDHCPIFRLAPPGAAPVVRLTHPLLGERPGEFTVSVRGLGAKRRPYRVKVLIRKDPFDPDVREVESPDQPTPKRGLVELKEGEEVKLRYSVPHKGWRNQYRVEVWDQSERQLYFRSLWYSLGEDVLSYGWDSRRPQLGILPEPQQILLDKGEFPLSEAVPVLVSDGNAADMLAASFLSKPIGALSREWPTFETVEVRGRAEAKGKLVLLGDTSRHLWMQDILQRRDVELPQMRPRPQGYTLLIRPDLIVIAGNDAGAFYGVQTLRQLILRDRRSLPAMRIVDWPDLEWRGAWHTFQVNEANIDLACLFKMNVGGLSLQEKKKYHFRPLYFTAHTWFGHTGGALVPEEKREPAKGEAVICPASDCTAELTATIDRFAKRTGVDASEMPYVFVGGDEAPFGLCERCQKMIDERGAGGTVAHHFRDNMYAACKARGKTMMCWADALLGFEDSLNAMPKDFVPLHWMYYATTYSGGIDLLGKHGLPFVSAAMSRGEQSFHFPQIRSRERNIATQARCTARANGKGIWTTTWGGGIHDDLLWYSYLLAAEYGWSAGPDIKTFRRKFGRLFYGSDNGGDWLLELERLTALYLSESDTPPPTLGEDRSKLIRMEQEIGAQISRNWYTKDKLATLLKVVNEVEKKCSQLR